MLKISQVSKRLFIFPMILAVCYTFLNPSTPIAQAANDPFVCSPGFYQVIDNQLKLLNPTNGQYTDIGGPAPYYNSMGYNIEDNYIYGITRVSNIGHLLKIGSDGSTVDLGIPVGQPANNYLAGDFDHSGNLYVSNGGNTIYKVDVSALTITPVTLTGPAIGGADLVFIDNKLYSLANQTLYIVDLSNNTSSTVTVTGVPVTAAYGAGWTDQDGHLYFGLNVTGEIYEISNYTSGSPTGSLKLAAAVATANDGASCPVATSTFDPPIAANNSYSVAHNTTLAQIDSILDNDTGSGLTVTAHTNPAHGSLTINPDGTFTYIPNSGFSGVDSFNYTITDSFGRTATATVILTISPPTLPAVGPHKDIVALLEFTVCYAIIFACWQMIRKRKIHQKIVKEL